MTRSFGECANVVRASIPSPNGSKSVVVFRQECGATVPYNTQASIVPIGEAPSPGKHSAFFVTSGTPELLVTWIGDSAVEIALIPGGGHVFRSEPNASDVKIVYK
jgi:hypothetical protein